MVNPITIISSRFLASNPLDLSIIRNPFTLTRGNYTVTDADGRVMFEVQGSLFSLVSRRVLLDAAGTPILTLQRQLWHLPFRWEWDVYKGDSKEKIFSAIRSPYIPYKTSLNVFLGCNTKQNVCDFKVEGSWFNQSCTIYAQDGTTTVAKMQKNHSVESIALGKDRFDVTVYPNVDYAFIVALVVILDQSKTRFQCVEEILGQGIQFNEALQYTIEKHDATASGSPLPLQPLSFLTHQTRLKHIESREVNPEANNMPSAPLIPTSSNEIEEEENSSSP
ncbi:hypothetical protein CTI12_AA075960 [Artemisia annua]|uniref:Uncharacterized protein n=1 Tax=Artemisia annua TaxID=35608 RepID=A0A2U1Q4Q3_ARTAN|nr:hypothetical protein CTI12_AA075960 [Artemisia annua]